MVSLFVIWLTDYIRFQTDKRPIFCLKENIYKYDDGITEECIGLGYKIYQYDRTSINLNKEFSSFFQAMKK